MAKTIIRTETEEIEDTLAEPTKWLRREFGEQTKRTLVAKPPESAQINLYAEVRHGDTQSVVQVAEWKPEDLYAYSDAPRVELLNFFDELLHSCQSIADAAGPLEYELKTVDLWQKLKGLNRFFGISAVHDELLAALLSIPTGADGILDEPKLAALVHCFSLLRDLINVTDDVLDHIEDSLDAAGFDLQAPMQSLVSIE